MFSYIGEKRKEPDILLLDKELGVIIIEVKDYSINNIQKIECNNWILKGLYTKTINPLDQAEGYLYSIKSRFDLDRNIRGKIRGQYFIAMPNISKMECRENGFHKNIDESYIIFKY